MEGAFDSATALETASLSAININATIRTWIGYELAVLRLYVELDVVPIARGSRRVRDTLDDDCGHALRDTSEGATWANRG